MSLPAILPQIYFDLITKDFDRVTEELVNGGAIVAKIYNDAKSADDYYYWRIVNDGRGPIRPVRASVLHWIDTKSGRHVFSMYARGFAPRHMRERAIPAIQQAIVSLKPGQPLNRQTIAEFVNKVAEIAVDEMARRTPIVTGKLYLGYRIEKAFDV